MSARTDLHCLSGLYASYFIPCSLLLWRRTTGQIVTASHAPNAGIWDDESGSRTGGTGERGLGAANKNTGDSSLGGAAKDEDDKEAVVQPLLVWGPWRLPGYFGIANNIFACVYILFVLFWSFWPPATPVTPQSMNYSVLMTGVVVTFSVFYYYVWGKKEYLGPLVEKEVRHLAVHRK